MKTRIIGAIVALVLAGVGAFVLIGYVRGADARAAEGAEMADVYIVQELIPKGTSGDTVADYVEVDSVPQRNIAEGAVTDLDDLAGLVAAADLLPGEQLLEARFADPADLAAQGDVPGARGHAARLVHAARRSRRRGQRSAPATASAWSERSTRQSRRKPKR